MKIEEPLFHCPFQTHPSPLLKQQVEKAIQGLQNLESNQDKQAFYVDTHLLQLEDGASALYYEALEDLLTDVSESVGLPSSLPRNCS